MTTWTPKTEDVEAWEEHTQTLRVFSPYVFSRDLVGAQNVFAIGSSAGIWDDQSSTPETWTTQ